MSDQAHGLPAVGAVRRLSASAEFDVSAEMLDENSHLTIGQYFHHATWSSWEACGMDQSVIEKEQVSFFVIEHSARYVGELVAGDRLSVRSGIVARTDKALHTATFVVDEGHDRLSYVLETVFLHVSMQTRRTVPIVPILAERVDRLAALTIESHALDGLELRLALR